MNTQLTIEQEIYGGIKPPKSQIQECLYLLLEKGKMSRKDYFNESGMLNAPANIMILRNKGVLIETTFTDHVNKFGRNIQYGTYKLLDYYGALEIYKNLK